METNSDMNKLLQKIDLLKEKQELEWQLLKSQYKLTRESLKPINLIKNAFLNKVVTTSLKGNLINMGLGLTTNYLIDKMESKPSDNRIKKVINSVLKFIKDKTQ